MTAQPYQPATDRPAIDEDEAGGRAIEEDGAGAHHLVSSSYEPAQGLGSGAGQFDATPPPASDPDLVVIREGAVPRPEGAERPGDAGRLEDVVTGTVVEADTVDDGGTDDYGAADYGARDPGAGTSSTEDDETVEDDLDAGRTTATPVTTSPLTARLLGKNAATGGTRAADARSTDLGQQWHDIQAMFVDDPPGSVQRAAAAADAAVSALAEIMRERQAALSEAGGGSADTEQLRETLRSYRIFCQSLADVGWQLRQPRP